MHFFAIWELSNGLCNAHIHADLLTKDYSYDQKFTFSIPSSSGMVLAYSLIYCYSFRLFKLLNLLFGLQKAAKIFHLHTLLWIIYYLDIGNMYFKLLNHLIHSEIYYYVSSSLISVLRTRFFKIFFYEKGVRANLHTSTYPLSTYYHTSTGYSAHQGLSQWDKITYCSHSSSTGLTNYTPSKHGRSFFWERRIGWSKIKQNRKERI